MCDGVPNAPSRSSIKAECEVGHQNFFTDLPGNRSGVKMVAVGVAEDDDVVFTLLFSAGAHG